jgi:hypothetical protein
VKARAMITHTVGAPAVGPALLGGGNITQRSTRWGRSVIVLWAQPT